MNKTVQEAMTEINENINELQGQLKLIESIDFTKPVSEEEWHAICETPLRSSDLLATLVKNIFPDAENILVHCNYVYFDLMGFKVQIPTSRARGINVDLSWYEKDGGEPTQIYHETTECKKRYLEALDRKADWHELAKIRCRFADSWSKPRLFLWWHFKSKWMKIDRPEWEKFIKSEEESFQKRLTAYHEKRKKIKEKSEKLIHDVIPILDTFSTKHSAYNQALYPRTIEEIKELENL